MVSWYERRTKQQWSKWRYNHAMCLKRTVENHKQTRSAAMILHTLTLRSRSINWQFVPTELGRFNTYTIISEGQVACMVKIKIKQSHYRTGEALRVPVGRGSQISRQSPHESGKFVSLTHRPPLPQEIFLIHISVRGWVDPRTIVRPERLCQWKTTMILSGIETVTFRLVAQCLNQMRYFVPQHARWIQEVHFVAKTQGKGACVQTRRTCKDRTKMYRTVKKSLWWKHKECPDWRFYQLMNTTVLTQCC